MGLTPLKPSRRPPHFIRISLCALCVLCGELLRAETPTASYIFPAGAQRGTTADARVGGLFLHSRCSFEMLGPGVQVPKVLRPTPTLWLEGPLLPLPDSQQQEDYPKDMAAKIAVAADAPLGERLWRVWTSQGVTPAMKFVVGDLPEITEEEIAGEPIPVSVRLPLTVNGRVFPREDVDLWAVDLKQGQTITADLHAARLGSPLDARLEVLSPEGRLLTDNDDAAMNDPRVRFTAPTEGRYLVRVTDVNAKGGQAYVYRLTLTADAFVDRVYPLGGRRGSTVALHLFGQGTPNEPVAVALPADARGDFQHSLTLNGRTVPSLLLDVDDLPEVMESQAVPVQPPVVLNGRLDKAGEIDNWAITAKKGDVFDVELRANRLGSPLLGVLAVLDAGGQELSRAEPGGPNSDPQLRFTAPADGTFAVRVTDQFRSRGGPEFAYRLRIAPPSGPDFRLTLATDAVSVPRAGQAKLKVQAERRGGFAEPIALAVEGLPSGVTVAPATIPAGQNTVEVTFKAESSSAIAAKSIAVKGTAKIGERTATLTPSRGGIVLDQARLAVTLPTPFKVVGDYDMRWASRGGTHTRRYRLERNGFDGPLQVSLTDKQARHLQGVTGPTITVPAGATEFDYTITLPPWMETGRTCRVCVMAVGVLKEPDGVEHEVSFSSVHQNEQLVAVVEPGRLSVECERPSVVLEPGQTVALPVRVARTKGLTGAVKVELLIPGHVQGVKAEAVEVVDGRDTASLMLHLDKGALGPFNMPLTVRATAVYLGQPVVAETPVDVRPDR